LKIQKSLVCFNEYFIDLGLSDGVSTSFLTKTGGKMVLTAKHGQSKSKAPTNYAKSASVVGSL
jgi:hypothetical protein